MPRRILAAVLFLALPLSACNTWMSIHVLPEPMPRRVRVELRSGERVEITGPRLEADTLVGQRPDESVEARIPLGDVVQLEQWEDGSAVAVLGFAAFGGLLYLIASMIETGIGPGG
jgi:hypothetical protein